MCIIQFKIILPLLFSSDKREVGPGARLLHPVHQPLPEAAGQGAQQGEGPAGHVLARTTELRSARRRRLPAQCLLRKAEVSDQ